MRFRPRVRVVRARVSPGRTVDALPNLSGPMSVAVGGDRVAVAREDGPVLVAPLPDDLALALRDAQITAHDYKALPQSDAASGRGHAHRRVPDRAGPPRVRARRSRGRVRRGADARAGGGGGDRRARARGRGPAAARPARCAHGCASAGARSCTTASSCRSPRCSPRWRTPASRSTRIAWARSRRGSPTGSRSSSHARTSSPAASSCSARRSSSRACCSRSSG